MVSITAKKLMSHPEAARGMLDLRGGSRGARGGGAGGKGDPPSLRLSPSSQLRSRHLGRGHHKTQSLSVPGQPDAVCEDPGEGQQSAPQLQHLLGNISTRILLTVLCTKHMVRADLKGWFVPKSN